MAQIVPTVLTANIDEFNAQLETFSSFAKRIQVDVSDGTFASSILVLPSQMKFPENVAIDLHMMTTRPSEYLAQILALRPSLLIVHAEVDDDLPSFFQHLKAAGIKVGVALLKTTLPKRAEEIIAQADHVLIFAGSLGEQGGKIDMLQTEKIPLIKAIKPDAEIGWDGGANLSNVRALAHSGVDVINVGSALSRAADPAAMYQSLVAEWEKKGVLV